MKIVNGTVEPFHSQQVLAKSIADNLKIRNVRTPHFYITHNVQERYTSMLYHPTLKTPQAS